MDKVDIAKGNSSIKAMALGQAGFQTLMDAFLFVKDEKDVDKTPYSAAASNVIGKLARNSVKGISDAASAMGSSLNDLYKSAPKAAAPAPAAHPA